MLFDYYYKSIMILIRFLLLEFCTFLQQYSKNVYQNDKKKKEFQHFSHYIWGKIKVLIFHAKKKMMVLKMCFFCVCLF